MPRCKIVRQQPASAASIAVVARGSVDATAAICGRKARNGASLRDLDERTSGGRVDALEVLSGPRRHAAVLDDKLHRGGVALQRSRGGSMRIRLVAAEGERSYDTQLGRFTDAEAIPCFRCGECCRRFSRLPWVR